MAEVPDKLRILLFGKSDDKKIKLMNFITGNQSRKPDLEASGEWKGNHLKVVRTPDLFTLSVEKVIGEIKNCVCLCSPGPNVLLLLVKPSEFTEKDRETLNFILSLFGPDAFTHAMVVITHNDKENICVNEVLCDCNGRFHNMFEENHDILMTNIEIIVQKNKGSFLTITKKTDIENTNIPPSLNLVLCGSRGAEKSSVVQSIVSQAAAPSPGQCVKHQGEVCGRWVSLVELPALSGKPLEAVMQQCLSCISLCGPEGVHAFILVLPVGPLTDEDKAELQTIQDTFSSAVNPFTMILFTVDSDPTAPAKIAFVQRDRDIQELSQSCGRRFDFFHLSDKNQVQKLIDMSAPKEQPHMYTTGMFWSAQAEKIKQQTNLLKTSICSDQEKLSPQTLRIVLIGKTGSGKSSSANTILGRDDEVFKADLSQTSVTKVCQKELSTVDGRHVAVVDTPGLFDSTMSNEEVMGEMLSCVSLLSPGPHVFLLVLEIGRFTAEEKETLRLIKHNFGKDAEKFTMILFTHGDMLKQKKHKMSLDQFIKEKCDDSCKKLISDCGNRYHVFDNLDENNQDQVTDLIKKIDDMVLENGGGCFTTEMFQEAEAAIKKEMKRILQEKEEEMEREREFLKNKYKQEMEEIKQKLEKQKNEIEKERLVRETELKEKEQKIEEERAIREREQKKREDEDKQRKEQEEQQRQDWADKHRVMEEKIKSSEESKETIDQKLKETRKQMEQEREDLEKERQMWWENRRKEEDERRKEEKQRLRKLQEEIEQERESERIKRQVEDRVRQEQERKERHKLEEKHQKQVEELRNTYEEKARKKAEELNDFKDKKKEEMEELLNRHIKDVQDLQKQYEDEKNDIRKNYDTTLNESEAILKNQITDLQHKQKQEMSEMVICILTKKKKNRNDIQSMKKRHQKEIENAYEELEDEFKKKERKGLKELKTKLDNAIKDLKHNTVNKEDLKNEKKRLRLENENEQLELKTALLKEQTDSEGPRKAKLQKKHQQELSDFMENLLKENEALIAELKSKQEKEMKELKEKMTPQNEESRKETEELEKKHTEEMKELKDKLLTPEEKPCSIS